MAKQVVNPWERSARWHVGDALRKGTLKKPSRCEHCQQPEHYPGLVGHHEDYRKPLAVIWLCSRCHGLAHRRINRNPTHPRWNTPSREAWEKCVAPEGAQPPSEAVPADSAA